MPCGLTTPQLPSGHGRAALLCEYLLKTIALLKQAAVTTSALTQVAIGLEVLRYPSPFEPIFENTGLDNLFDLYKPALA